MKTKFLTFGGNAHGRGKRFRTAAVRITGQARNSGLFDEIKLYTDLSLPHEFPTFWSQHGKFIEANNRGYGYWLWKPFLILEAIKPMREGDVLLYADAGCELNLSARERLRCYICDPAPDRLLLGTAGIIKNWIKMDAIQRVGLDAMQTSLTLEFMKQVS